MELAWHLLASGGQILQITLFGESKEGTSKEYFPSGH